MTIELGVTGTRREPSTRQLDFLYGQMLSLHDRGCRKLHHGCCTGFDAAAHHLARSLGWKIKGHPPISSVYLAEKEWLDCDESLPTQEYAARNASIVRASTQLIAAPLHPRSAQESQRSGTWMTARMANEAGIPWAAVLPDGSTLYGEW